MVWGRRGKWHPWRGQRQSLYVVHIHTAERETQSQTKAVEWRMLTSSLRGKPEVPERPSVLKAILPHPPPRNHFFVL